MLLEFCLETWLILMAILEQDLIRDLMKNQNVPQVSELAKQ